MYYAIWAYGGFKRICACDWLSVKLYFMLMAVLFSNFSVLIISRTLPPCRR